jgi:hypothetical protein
MLRYLLIGLAPLVCPSNPLYTTPQAASLPVRSKCHNHRRKSHPASHGTSHPDYTARAPPLADHRTRIQCSNPHAAQSLASRRGGLSGQRRLPPIGRMSRSQSCRSARRRGSDAARRGSSTLLLGLSSSRLEQAKQASELASEQSLLGMICRSGSRKLRCAGGLRR